jgi:hypothetical protein
MSNSVRMIVTAIDVSGGNGRCGQWIAVAEVSIDDVAREYVYDTPVFSTSGAAQAHASRRVADLVARTLERQPGNASIASLSGRSRA